MPLFTFNREGKKYSVQIDVNISLDFSNTETIIEGSSQVLNEEPIKVQFKLKSNYQNHQLNLYYIRDADEILIADFNLDDFEDIDLENIPRKGDGDPIFQKGKLRLNSLDQLEEMIGDEIQAKTIEQIIQAIPTGDPTLGCLLKSTISTVVGKTIHCWQQNRELAIMEFAGAMLNCIRSNLSGLGIKIGYKMGLCFLTLGMR